MFGGVRLNYLQERVLFGKKATDAVPAEAERVGAQRVFLVTTRYLGGASGYVADIAKALGARHAGTYAGIGAFAPKDQVVAAANQARAAKADLIVSVGGGSVTDGAKVMQRCLWENITTPDALQPNRVFGAHVVPGLDPTVYPAGADSRVRLIAVPATFSAAEFNFGGSVMDTATGTKDAHAHPLMIPRAVILDPEATRTTPQNVLLPTGLKVLVTCIARYCNPANNIATEIMAREAMRQMPGALRAMKARPDDLEPRLIAQLATWWTRDADFHGIYGSAGSAITQVLGQLGVPDGVAGAIAMPATFRWNRGFDDARQAEVAALMGAAGQPLDALISGLARDIGLPTRLRDVGVRREDFPSIASKAMGNAQIKGNPRPVNAPADMLEILELAW